MIFSMILAVSISSYSVIKRSFAVIGFVGVDGVWLLFHLSLRNRLPALRQTPISESDTDSQNDERQALKRIVVFFAVMLILTLVARGTSSAIRPVVTTQQAKVTNQIQI